MYGPKEDKNRRQDQSLSLGGMSGDDPPGGKKPGDESLSLPWGSVRALDEERKNPSASQKPEDYEQKQAQMQEVMNQDQQGSPGSKEAPAQDQSFVQNQQEMAQEMGGQQHDVPDKSMDLGYSRSDDD